MASEMELVSQTFRRTVVDGVRATHLVTEMSPLLEALWAVMALHDHAKTTMTMNSYTVIALLAQIDILTEELAMRDAPEVDLEALGVK